MPMYAMTAAMVRSGRLAGGGGGGGTRRSQVLQQPAEAGDRASDAEGAERGPDRGLVGAHRGLAGAPLDGRDGLDRAPCGAGAEQGVRVGPADPRRELRHLFRVLIIDA